MTALDEHPTGEQPAEEPPSEEPPAETRPPAGRFERFVTWLTVLVLA